MAQVVYSRTALDHLQRAHAFLHDENPGAARAALDAIREAVSLLAKHPFVGRPVDGEIRELVISFGATGYVALYEHSPAEDIVRVLAIRHQRELDYRV